MARCYRHLQCDERCQIRALRKQGAAVSEIARQLGYRVRIQLGMTAVEGFLGCLPERGREALGG